MHNWHESPQLIYWTHCRRRSYSWTRPVDRAQLSGAEQQGWQRSCLGFCPGELAKDSKQWKVHSSSQHCVNLANPKRIGRFKSAIRTSRQLTNFCKRLQSCNSNKTPRTAEHRMDQSKCRLSWPMAGPQHSNTRTAHTNTANNTATIVIKQNSGPSTACPTSNSADHRLRVSGFRLVAIPTWNDKHFGASIRESFQLSLFLVTKMKSSNRSIENKKHSMLSLFQWCVVIKLSSLSLTQQTIHLMGLNILNRKSIANSCMTANWINSPSLECMYSLIQWLYDVKWHSFDMR